MAKIKWTVIVGLIALCLVASPASAATAVAVFNFQMKSDTPDWQWLEKALADRVITDIFQSKDMAVLQRDEMQKIAAEVHWAPEMMNNPGAIRGLQSRPEYLISGTYEVKEGRVSITAIVVDFKTAKEMARRQVSGKADEVLDLVRDLSAQILGWLTKRKPEDVKGELPVWTRSIPAAKAVYEGVHLYDQGRYAEAWLYFRRAARDDPAYAEANYWVGKMYYFMDRHDHARLALEKFLYQETVHPRLGDALIEYLHTYETADLPGEKLMALYQQVLQRFGRRSDNYNEAMNDPNKVESDARAMTVTEWLVSRMARLAEQQGDYRKAMALTTVEGKIRFGYAPVCRCLLPDYMVHGSIYDGIVEKYDNKAQDIQTRVTSLYLLRLPASNVEVTGWRWRTYDPTPPPEQNFWLAAPDGFVFKKLMFSIAAPSEAQDMLITLSEDMPGDVAQLSKPAAEVTREGVCLDTLPRTGLVYCHLEARDQDGDIVDLKDVVRVKGELEKIGPHGTLFVVCANTPDFRVDVDGLPGRQTIGLIGLLSPGEHTLTFRPSSPDAPFGECRTTARVVEGRVTRVEVRLPWKKDSPWSGWTSALLGSEEYPGFRDLDLEGGSMGQAMVLADEEAIHVVWMYGRDLWLSASRDGEHYTPARKIVLPVSSAWREENPFLFRDESGRYVLWFDSDRGLLHHCERYSCWSRDLEHWSAPAMVGHKVMPVGRFKCGDAGDELEVLDVGDGKDRARPRISMSSNFWPESRLMIPVTRPYYYGVDQVLRREDGRWEAFGGAGGDPREKRTLTHYSSWLSEDLKSWSDPQTVVTIESIPDAFQTIVAAVREAGSTRVLMQYSQDFRNSSWLVGYSRDARGDWQPSAKVMGVGSMAHLTWHPKWGYIMALVVPQGHEWYYHPGYGPIIMRGPSLEPIFGPLAKQPPSEQYQPAGTLAKKRVPIRGFFDVSMGKARTVVYVVSGAGLHQDTVGYVRNELRRSVNSLDLDQNFDIFYFQDTKSTLALRDQAVAATAENKKLVEDFVPKIKAGASDFDPTNALTKALDLRPDVIYLIGVHAVFEPAVLKQMAQLNADHHAIINTISVKWANGISELALQRIAKRNGGTYRHIDEDEAARAGQ